MGMGMILLLATLGLACCVSGVIPPSSVCYQDTYIRSACEYGNLSVLVTGKTYRPKDCNSYMELKEIEHPPFLYINSTNATERFTMVLLDLGASGQGPPYLQWMLTNVTINTLPDYANSMAPGNVVVPYEKPLIMSGMPNPHLVQILIFRHFNVLRVPFGELWVSHRQNFQLRQLYSNTQSNLRLCGPVAGIQFWMYDGRIPAGPPPAIPVQGGYIPPSNYNPAQTPPGNYNPAQSPPSNYNPPPPPGFNLPPQPGFNPAPQPGYNPAHQPPPTHFNRKPNSATFLQPFKLLLIFTVIVKICLL